MLAVVRAKINDHDVRLEIQRVGVGRTPDVGKITMMQQRRGTHAEVAHVVICPQPLTELHRIGCFVRSSFVHWCFCWFRRQAPPPNTVGFQRHRAATHITAALAENLPHRSREHEFSAGRVLSVKDTFVLKTSLTRVTGFGRVGGGSNAPLPRKRVGTGLGQEGTPPQT